MGVSAEVGAYFSIYSTVPEIVGCTPQGEHNAMIEGAQRSMGNRCTYTFLIDNGFIYSNRGHEVFSLSTGGFTKNN